MASRYSKANKTDAPAPEKTPNSSIRYRKTRTDFRGSPPRSSLAAGSQPRLKGSAHGNNVELNADSDEDSDYEILEGFWLDELSVIQSDNETVDENKNDADGSPATRLKTPIPGREDLHIVSSKFEDDTLHGDDTIWSNSTGGLAAEIDAIAMSADSTVKVDPLYRWVHLYQERMEFDEFHSISSSLPGLTNTDNEQISWILHRARKEAVEPFVDRFGTKGRVAKPVVITRTIKKQMSNMEVYTFINFPLFSLQRYLAPKAGDQDQLHHIRTLMQSRHPSVTKQRDLQQAVCQVLGTPRETCFHVSSLWCLTISDKYLVTYSRGVNIKHLCGDLIKLRFLPPRQVPNARPIALQIVHSDDIYLVPFEKCSTWFSLSQLFYWITSRFDDNAQVFWKNREIGPPQWPSVIKRARQKPQRVVVQWRDQAINRALLKASLSGIYGKDETPETVSEQQGSVGQSIQPEVKRQTRAPQGLLQPSSPNASRSQIAQIPQRSPSTTPMSMESYLDEFQTLRWIAVQRSMTNEPDQQTSKDISSPHIFLESAPPRKVYDQQLKEFLDGLSTMMDGVQEPQKRTLYQKCPLKSLDEVKKALAGITRIDSDNSEVINMKNSLLSAAVLAFQAFLPLDQQGSICSKFWGALHQSITTRVEASAIQHGRAHRTVTELVQIAKKAVQIQHQLSHGKGPNPHEVKLPANFVRAWYYLLSCILNMTWTPEANGRAWKYVQKLDSELKDGYSFIFGEDKGRRLLEFRAVMSTDIPAFLIQRVVGGIDGSTPSTEKACWAYFGELETELKKDPLSRSCQVKASLLLDELEALRHHMDEQLRILSQLSEYFPFQTSGDEFYDRFQVRALGDVTGLVRSKRDSLEDLQEKALRLVSASKENRERARDHRDAAIYVFTIVTAIFLPISTVSSIFGMNTKDVRDMEKTQWLFWATAIPVTIVTLLVSFVGAGIVSVRRQELALSAWRGDVYTETDETSNSSVSS